MDVKGETSFHHTTDLKKIPDFYTAVAGLDPEAPQGENSFRHTVAHMDPDDPAFANHQAFLKTYQTDYRNLVLWQSELERAYRDGASDKEIQWIKDTIARTESRLKKKEHQGPFSLALEAGEAAKAQGRYREVTYEIPGILDRPRKQIIMEGKESESLRFTTQIPFEIQDLIRQDGGIKQRRLFDGNKGAFLDYDPTDHGNAKTHPLGGHKHLIDITGIPPRAKDIEITEQDVMVNKDMHFQKRR